MKQSVKDLIDNKISLENEIQKANGYVDHFEAEKKEMRNRLLQKEERNKQLFEETLALKKLLGEKEESLKMYKMKAEAHSEPRFKEFVMMKRDNKLLKQENLTLKGSLDNLSISRSTDPLSKASRTSSFLQRTKCYHP